MQIYYAKQFFAVSSVIEKAAFYQRAIAFYEDYVTLDRVLAPEVVILVRGFQLDSVYAPRPVFSDEADLPPERPAVLLAPPRATTKQTSRRRLRGAVMPLV